MLWGDLWRAFEHRLAGLDAFVGYQDSRGGGICSPATATTTPPQAVVSTEIAKAVPV